MTFWPTKKTMFLSTVSIFPLLAVLVPQWLRLATSTSVKFLYLVSGSGTPRNTEHDELGNSSRNLAKVIDEAFIRVLYPQVETVVVHSGPGLFSFAQNIRFMNTVLKPLINRRRMQLASSFGEDWVDKFGLTVTLLNGPSARTQALNASLREYRPDYLYLSQNKTLWHRYPDVYSLWNDDCEVLKFSTAEMTPAVPLKDVDTSIKLLVLETMQHRDLFARALMEPKFRVDPSVYEESPVIAPAPAPNELENFWLRKTGKPVLSVLMVLKPGMEPSFFRGINMEVSMPTGSLCAERSAIANALAHDPTLRREDMKMIAVLSVELSENVLPVLDEAKGQQSQGAEAVQASNPILPCGACQEWLRKIAACNPDFQVITFDDTSCSQIHIQPVL